MAGWISDVYVKTKSKKPNSVVYLAALVVSAPAFWLVASEALFQKDKMLAEVDGTSKNCSTRGLSENLNNLSEGVVLASADMAPFILDTTKHRVLSGNYHRNWKGIAAEIQIFISEPSKSKEFLRESNVNYVYYCASSKAAYLHGNHNKSGLAAQLSQGNIPHYLEVIPLLDAPGSTFKIFRVKASRDDN